MPSPYTSSHVAGRDVPRHRETPDRYGDRHSRFEKLSQAVPLRGVLVPAHAAGRAASIQGGEIDQTHAQHAACAGPTTSAVPDTVRGGLGHSPHAAQHELSALLRRHRHRSWTGRRRGRHAARRSACGLGPNELYSWFWAFEDNDTINEIVDCHCSDQHFRVRTHELRRASPVKRIATIAALRHLSDSCWQGRTRSRRHPATRHRPSQRVATRSAKSFSTDSADQWPQGANYATTTSNCADINVKPTSGIVGPDVLPRGKFLLQQSRLDHRRDLGHGRNRRSQRHRLSTCSSTAPPTGSSPTDLAATRALKSARQIRGGPPGRTGAGGRRPEAHDMWTRVVSCDAPANGALELHVEGRAIFDVGGCQPPGAGSNSSVSVALPATRARGGEAGAHAFAAVRLHVDVCAVGRGDGQLGALGPLVVGAQPVH